MVEARPKLRNIDRIINPLKQLGHGLLQKRDDGEPTPKPLAATKSSNHLPGESPEQDQVRIMSPPKQPGNLHGLLQKRDDGGEPAPQPLAASKSSNHLLGESPEQDRIMDPLKQPGNHYDLLQKRDDGGETAPQPLAASNSSDHLPGESPELDQDRIMDPLRQPGNLHSLLQKRDDGGEPAPQPLAATDHLPGESPEQDQYVQINPQESFGGAEELETTSSTELEADDIVIVVMGPMSSEKITLIQRVANGRATEVGQRQEMLASKVRAFRFRDLESGRHIVLVDAPGPDGTRPKSEREIFRIISEWLVSSYKKKKLSSILYLPRITDNHVPSKPLKKIRKLYEKDALHKVYLATAIWNEVELSPSERNLEELEKAMAAQEINVVRCRKDDNPLSELVRRMIHLEYSIKTDSYQINTQSRPSPPKDQRRPLSHLRQNARRYDNTRKEAPLPCRSPSPRLVSGVPDYSEPLCVADPLNATSFNIVIFGEAGVGKSSIINLIAGRDIAATSPDAWGCTLESTLYKFEVGNQAFNIWDTIGLGEPILSVSNCLGAIEKTYALIREIKAQGGLDLLLFCMPGSRVTTTMQYNYRLFFEVLCEERIPIAAVVTRLEDEDKMEDWWTRNEEYLAKNGLHFGGHVCVTGLRGHSKAEEGRSALKLLLQDYDRKGRYAMPPASDWFSGFLKRLHRIPRSKELKQKELEKSLQQRCLMTKADAQKLAETLTHPRKAEPSQQQPEPIEIDQNTVTANYPNKIGEET